LLLDTGGGRGKRRSDQKRGKKKKRRDSRQPLWKKSIGFPAYLCQWGEKKKTAVRQLSTKWRRKKRLNWHTQSLRFRYRKKNDSQPPPFYRQMGREERRSVSATVKKKEGQHGITPITTRKRNAGKRESPASGGRKKTVLFRLLLDKKGKRKESSAGTPIRQGGGKLQVARSSEKGEKEKSFNATRGKKDVPERQLRATEE